MTQWKGLPDIVLEFFELLQWFSSIFPRSSSGRKGKALNLGSSAEHTYMVSFCWSMYLLLKSWQIAALISFTISLSALLSWKSWMSWAWRGATTDSVGELSFDITRVAIFMGFIASTISSADVMSDSHRVQTSFSVFLSSLDKRAAETAGCCSRKRSSISCALFQRVTTSVISLCSGNSSNFCFCQSTWLAVVLRLKKVDSRLTRPNKRATAGSFSARSEARFKVWAKHLKSAATLIFAALSVTIAGSLDMRSHSSSAAFSNSAMFDPVWLSCMARVCKTCDISSHSSLT